MVMAFLYLLLETPEGGFYVVELIKIQFLILLKERKHNMRYKRYSGGDKYHFRFFKKAIFHPFIVVAVTEEKELNGQVLISGYMMTTSLSRAMDKPGCYKRLKENPNPNDDKLSFVNKYRVSDIPASYFTKPHPSWHLCKEDEQLIDALEKKYSKRNK